MKNIYRLALSSAVGLLFIIAVCFVIPQNVHSKIITNVPADLTAEQLKAIVVEDFEKADANKWEISSVPKKLDQPKKPEDNPVEILELKFIDGAPSDMEAEKWSSNNKGLSAKKCLGIHFKFRYPGYNSIHVVPKEPLKLPGRSKAISVWFHGRGHAYNLECWIEDYRGSTHILKFGSVNFVGWRPLKTFIPVNVPQKIESYPQTRWLKIKRFVIRAETNAGTVETFMFLDQIKTLTDDYEVNFDGRKLHEAFKGGTKTGK